MLNKKVLLSILIIGTVVVMAGTVTWATLSDSKTSDDSKITAGTLFLEGQAITPVVVTSTAPGDYGTKTQPVAIGGNLPGLLKIDVNDVKVPGTANSTAPIPNDDKLGDVFLVNIKLVNNDDTQVFRVAGTTDEEYVPLNSGFSKTEIPVDSGATYRLVTAWKIDQDADNGIQGQEVSFDEVYTLNSKLGENKGDL